MKKLLTIIAILLASAIFSYLLGVFYLYEWNPYNWLSRERGTSVAIFIICLMYAFIWYKEVVNGEYKRLWDECAKVIMYWQKRAEKFEQELDRINMLPKSNGFKISRVEASTEIEASNGGAPKKKAVRKPARKKAGRIREVAE